MAAAGARVLQRGRPARTHEHGNGGVPLRRSSQLGLCANGIDVGGGCSLFPTHGHQTFSTSGRPSRPEGRKIKTIARIENAATSLYSTEK